MTLALRIAPLALSLVALLGACGNQADMDPTAMLLRNLSQAAANRLGPQTAAAQPPSALELRAALADTGTAIIRLELLASGASTFMAPVAVNQGIRTWSTNERETVSMRDGVLLATRGFGSDIMSATAPSAAQIARGAGTYNRHFVYLDGADQVRKSPMTCTLSTAGAETITVLGLSYPTRHVVETCTGKMGTDTNDYWFRNGAILQSRQFLVPGAPGVKIQSILN